MRKTDYTVLIEPLSDEDGGGVLATAPDLPGCVSDGDTREAAAKNIGDAIACWLEEAKALGREFPGRSERPASILRKQGVRQSGRYKMPLNLDAPFAA